jgi:hypothetical protein
VSFWLENDWIVQQGWDLMIVNCLIVWLLFPVVLTRRGMRSSTNAYLTALAIADLVYLLCVFWLSLRHYPHVREDLTMSNFYAYTWPYSLWLTDATSKFFPNVKDIYPTSKYISDLDNALQSELERHFVSTSPAAPVLIITNHDELEAFPWRMCCLSTCKLLKTQPSVFIADFFLHGKGEWRNDVTGLLWTRVFDRN